MIFDCKNESAEEWIRQLRESTSTNMYHCKNPVDTNYLTGTASA